MIARKIHYWGRVQGVGFRFTTQRVASRHEIAGTVRNLATGEVEVFVEGDAAAIERFLADLEQTMAGHIEGRRDEDEPPRCLTGFAIVP